jgi:hypothetical protein
MDREDIIIASLADKESENLLKRSILKLPVNMFRKKINQEIFKFLRDGNDIMEMSDDHLEHLIDVSLSPRYALYKSANVHTKRETVSAQLSTHNNELYCQIMDEAQSAMLDKPTKTKDVRDNLIRRLMSVKTLSSSVSIQEAVSNQIRNIQIASDEKSLYVAPILGFPKLNKLLGGGIHKENILGLLGNSEAGKTSFAQYLLWCLGKSGHKILYITTEITPEPLSTKLSHIIAHDLKLSGYYQDVWKLAKEASHIEKYIRPIQQECATMRIDLRYTTSIAEIGECIYADDYDYVFIDHVHDIPGARSSDSSIAIDPLFDMLKTWKGETGGGVICVLQARKIGADHGNKKRDLIKEDCTGSQAIVSNMDTMISVDADFQTRRTELKIVKSRWEGQSGNGVRANFLDGSYDEV